LFIRSFKRGVEDFDVALLAQVGEPLVEEEIYLLLEEDLLDAGRDALEGGDSFAGGVLGDESPAVVGFDLLWGDVNTLAETLLDEGEDFKTVTEIGVDTLGGKSVSGEEGLPSVVGGAVLADAGGEFLADFREAHGDFFGRRQGCLGVFAANLLFDEGAADELIEGVGGG